LDGKVQEKELELTQALNRPQPAPVEIIKEVVIEKPVEVIKEVFIDRPIEVIKEVYIEKPVDPLPPEPEPLQEEDHAHADPAPISPMHRPLSDHEHDPIPINTTLVQNRVVIPDFSIGAEETAPVNADFGDTFPSDPQKGDMYLRVDMLPSKLFKWNEKKWIEVDKTKTDSFAYDRAYIQHLIEKIDTGEYDVDLLTDAEREQIKEYLNEQSKQ
jgi:hypothetical protein